LGAGDATAICHKVWVYESENVLVLHRWVKGGKAALLLLGFNKSPVTVVMREPAGRWQRSLDSRAKEFNGTEQDLMPAHLVVSSQGTSVAIPAYTAVVFFAD
jgi:hypothetical protein